MADDSEEAIEASANPLRWPDPSRPIINQQVGQGGLGGVGSGFGAGGGVNVGPGGAAGVGGSGGRAGMGGGPMGGGPMGAGSRRGDAEEADPAPDWLVEDEDVFGDDRLVAPPVIGEDRPGSGDGDGG